MQGGTQAVTNGTLTTDKNACCLPQLFLRKCKVLFSLARLPFYVIICLVGWVSFPLTNANEFNFKTI